MEHTKPETWKCPSDWHPDSDGEWEILKLSKLGELILKSSPEYSVELNIVDFTAVYFEVLKNNNKIAEIYVNRAEADSETPMFSAFYDDPEEELNTTDYNEVVEEINKSTNLWKV